jgi:CSLREA domain-containing protein
MGRNTEPSGGRSIRLRPSLSVLAAFAAALLFLWSAPAGDALAATFTVTQTTDAVDTNVGDGICDVDAATPGNQCSLRAAIQTANGLAGSHIISLPAGTYTLSVGGPVAANARGEDAAAKGDLDIVSGSNITVRSADTARGTVTIDGGALDRVFQVRSGGTLTLVGITVTNGNPGSDTGAGIRTDGALVLVGTTVRGSTTTSSGGGIYVSSGATATLDASTVDNNAGSTGGGIFVPSAATLTMRNSLVSNNRANASGGGLRLAGTATVTDSTFDLNDAPDGAGIHVRDSGQLTATRVTLSNNTQGSGIRINKSGALTSTLTNLTISGNAGGGIVIAFSPGNSSSATVNLTNVTIGTNAGSSFTNIALTGSNGTVTLNVKNTIFAETCSNTGVRTTTIPTPTGNGNLHTSASGCPGEDASTNGLVLGALADNGGFTKSLALGATSDALDIAASCPSTDQRGLPRTLGGATCDSGAYELKTTGNGPPVISTIPNQALNEDISTGPVAFMVADSDTPIGSATLSPSISGNTSPVIPTGSFTFQGSGVSRALFGTPDADLNGSGTVTVQVNDGTDIATVPAAFTLAFTAVNDAPVFNVVGGSPPAANEDVGAQTVVNFASGMAVGPSTAIAADESSQTLTGFTVTTTPLSGNLELASLPTVDTSTGTLTYQPVANTNGTMSINVALSDDGGTGNGGVNTSAVQTFTITVNAVNDAPSFSTLTGNPTAVLEDAGAQSVTTFATGMARGPLAATDEATQTLAFTAQVTGTTGNLAFSTPPAIDASTGALTYQTAANTNGTATVQVTLSDNGGVANGGVNTSAVQTFTITVAAVNDAPSFATLAGSPPAVTRDAGPQTVSTFATGMLRGPVAATDEAGQALAFTLHVTGTTGGLTFSTAPAIDATTGALTYQSAATSIGTATVQVILADNGGVANGGVATSTAQTFTITVNATATATASDTATPTSTVTPTPTATNAPSSGGGGGGGGGGGRSAPAPTIVVSSGGGEGGPPPARSAPLPPIVPQVSAPAAQAARLFSSDTLAGPARPAPDSGIISFPVAVSAEDRQLVQLRLDPSVLAGLPSSLQLRVVTGGSQPSVAASYGTNSGTSAAEAVAAPFDLRLVALDTASREVRDLPEGVANSNVELRLPLPSAVLAPADEVAWLMEVLGPDGEFQGYARPPTVFDPLTQQLVLVVRAEQLHGTLFLPVVWRTAYVRNHDPVAHIWSSPSADATDFGVAAPQWTRMQVMAPPLNQRLLVLNGFTGQPGWVALDGVGAVPVDDGLPVMVLVPADEPLLVPAAIEQSPQPEAGSDAATPEPLRQAPADEAPATASQVAPIGAPDSAQSYTVQAGDSLKVIAAQARSTVAALIEANPGINPDSLTIGQQLQVLPPAP